MAPLQVSPQVNLDSSASEESSDDEPSTGLTNDIRTCTIPAPRPLPPPPRPPVGMKTPKSSFPPKKCITVHCKKEKEKEALKEEIAQLKVEIDDCK